ncbi:MAG TPA: S24/S26 family peptidase [Thermoanaerobaculia bacterium]
MRSRRADALLDLLRHEPCEIIIRGDCMAPGIRDGDRIRVFPGRFYWPGDVVVFRGADDRLTAHRLLGYRPGAGGLLLVTRGDSCAVHDTPVPLAAVLGRAGDVRPSVAVRLSSLFRFFGLILARLGRR